MQTYLSSERARRAVLACSAFLVFWGMGCGVSYKPSSSPAAGAATTSNPIIACSAAPTSVVAGGIVTVSARASSPQDLPLTYSFAATAGTISNQGSVATLQTAGTGGVISVSCKAVDTQGNAASVTTLIVIEQAPSQPPSITCSANPSAVIQGGSASITSLASSPEGRPLTYSWSASSGAISGSGNTATYNSSSAAIGTVTITCGVGDDQGRTASATTTVAVTASAPPAPPSITCSASPSIIDQGGAATIIASASSPQGLPLSYSYSASAGSITETSSTAVLETSGISAGFVTVTCTVDQQGGGSASANTQVLLQSTTGEQAITAFQFTDSVGVNMHLAYPNSVYASNFPAILSAMHALGVTHYRDGLNQYAPSFQYENAETLGKAAIKADWLMDIHNSAAIIGSAYANAPDATESFEGPNEDDADAGATLTAFMQLLHDAIHGNAATANMPIIAPSFTQPASFQTQGNVSALVSNGNTHDYFGNRNPETAAYGGSFYNCGGYGSIEFNICLAQLVAANDPVISTETGYASGTGLSDAIIGRYELRTLFQSLSLGIPRTYIYELVDDPSSKNYGLMNTSFAPRPAYTAIKNTMAVLKDVSFDHPGKLDYTLTGQIQNVHHLLLEKADGIFYLAIWLGVESADPNNPSNSYTISPQNLTLGFDMPVGSSTVYLLDDNGNMTAWPTKLSGGSLSISATDRITLIALQLGKSH